MGQRCSSHTNGKDIIYHPGMPDEIVIKRKADDSGWAVPGCGTARSHKAAMGAALIMAAAIRRSLKI